MQDPLFDAQYADDIIFGGLGRDFLHGGDGDDAISGAEALAARRTPLTLRVSFDVPTGCWRSDADATATRVRTNPGQALAFGTRTRCWGSRNTFRRLGEFALYDEFDPRREDPPGRRTVERHRTVPAVEFFLNFETFTADGQVDITLRAMATLPPTTATTCSSAIWGNDWIVGGTGRDHAYGGLGQRPAQRRR